ncbi:MAG: hypothetical protein Fur002_17600 [Anaerolineales bacterium]
MKKIFLALILIPLAACAPAKQAQPTPDPNSIATALQERVFYPLTQTAEANPTATATFAPTPTETPSPEPTSDAPLKRPVVTAFTGCWTGPGENYTLISNIAEKKYVELLGVGSEPGWYIIKNPYFRNPCWIQASYLRLDPRLDTSKYPVMTPGP